MIEVKRETFKSDPIYKQVYESIKHSHKVADHTQRILFQNRHTKNFCEQARHYVILGGENPIYVHYDVASWWKEPAGCIVCIDSIGFYDNFIEFEVARLRGLHEAEKADIPNMN